MRSAYHMVHGTSQRPTGRPDDRRRARPTATASVILLARAGKVTHTATPSHPTATTVVWSYASKFITYTHTQTHTRAHPHVDKT